MSKANQIRHSVSMAYWANCVKEWRANGKPQVNINRMLMEMVEYSELHNFSDAVKIIEIADGLRCA